MNKGPTMVVEPRKKIVLSGASGMLGSALGQRHRAGYEVIRLVRNEAAAEGQVTWNPLARPVLRDLRALEGCEAAIHLGGANLAARRWTAAYRREIVESRVGSTRALAMVLGGLREPPRTLLVASAVGIYGERGEEIVDESSPAGEGFLAETCREWEAAAEPAREAGIRVVHARFGVVLGRGPGALAKMLPVFRLGLGGRLGSGRQWMSWVSLEDAVEAILFALATPGIAGPVNITAPQPVRNGEFTRTLGQALRRPAVLPVPAIALRIALGPMADEALLVSTRAVPAKLMKAGFVFRRARVEEALGEAGIRE
jgi:uncharacterized protein (TIGR01777 family)